MTRGGRLHGRWTDKSSAHEGAHLVSTTVPTASPTGGAGSNSCGPTKVNMCNMLTQCEAGSGCRRQGGGELELITRTAQSVCMANTSAELILPLRWKNLPADSEGKRWGAAVRRSPGASRPALTSTARASGAACRLLHSCCCPTIRQPKEHAGGGRPGRSCATSAGARQGSVVRTCVCVCKRGLFYPLPLPAA